MPIRIIGRNNVRKKYDDTEISTKRESMDAKLSLDYDNASDWTAGI